MKKKYICVKQHDVTDCGAACLVTIAKHYGYKMPISKVRQIAGTDKMGTNGLGVVNAAKKIGFSAKGVKGDHEAFFSEFPLPAIANVVIDQKLLHYVVIHEINKEDNKIMVADPAKGLVEYTPEAFFKIWTGVLILMVPSPEFQKGDETTSIFRRFFGLLKPQKKLMIHIFFASIIYTLLGIAGAFYFKFLLDDILPDQLSKTLHVISIGVILLHLFKVILSAFRSHLLLYLSQKIDVPMILGYYNHVLDLPMDFFGTRRVGEIISRFMDASKIREAISGATLTIMIDVLMAVVGGCILYSYNSTLFLVAFIMLVLYGVVVYAFNSPIKEVNKKQMEDNAQLTSYLVESLNGIETIKAYNVEPESKFQTEKRFVKLLKTVFKAGMIENFRNSLSISISSIGGVIILWIGAFQVLKGNLTVGQLLVFNSLLAYFVDPVKNLINLQPLMQTAIVASDRLGEILDLELEKNEDEDGKISPNHISGVIEFNNVHFRYGTRSRVLEEINIKVQQGERIALVGESGSGKTSLVKLLLNLYKVESGDILINGHHIDDINLNTLRDKIAYVPQETFLFSSSIKENIRLGCPSKNLEDIIEAAKMANAHDFINQLPVRYESLLEENGSNLSGGQRQRISIARALLRKPDILILDEATSHLDSIAEKAIETTLKEATEGITTFIIAHRLSTIKQCDRILVMDHGRIVEEGTHTELVKGKGRYYDLWKGQKMEDYDHASVIEWGEQVQ